MNITWKYLDKRAGVVEAFYGADNEYGSNAADEVADYFQVERASVYSRKNRILKKLTVLLFRKP